MSHRATQISYQHFLRTVFLWHLSYLTNSFSWFIFNIVRLFSDQLEVASLDNNARSPNRHILNLEYQGYSYFLRSFNSFHISLKLKSDEAIYVVVTCNCNVINYI